VGENIELHPEEVMGHVHSIYAATAQVAMPGPVPAPSMTTSPIDAAVNAVVEAVAVKAAESSKALVSRGSEHHLESTRAVTSMQGQEEKNAGKIAQIQSQVPGAGLTEN
jgi:hypothetical protein